MSDEQINKAIAVVIGYEFQGDFPHTPDESVKPPKGPLIRFDKLPNYCNDLNAMHEAENVLTDKQHRQYRSEVWYSVCNDISSYECVKAAERPHFSATARQRAEAFLKTIGKWEDGK